MTTAYVLQSVAMLPEEFVRIRKSAGYTQTQLAKKVLRCHQVHVSRMETGVVTITEETAGKMRDLRHRLREKG